ncbi:hypothetical protein [Blautia sp. An249]|uniref:hypothetical protein n=1 Tax=Blautia sp. An249 TaxID=1965603 RepID=UPI0013A605EB|nr:hypothetical protein [Blautia sp. An249]
MKNLIISVLAALLTCQMDFWMWRGAASYFTGVLVFTVTYAGLIAWMEEKATKKDSRT